ncbi:MAG: hypothetical protein P4L76_18120 [Beijerinckiaceae bacterium]|nr:hypothetical protein [Beijerinckiaceae bacterium]
MIEAFMAFGETKPSREALHGSRRIARYGERRPAFKAAVDAKAPGF